MRGLFSFGSVAILVTACSISDSSLTVHKQVSSGGMSNGSGGESESGGAGNTSGGASQAGGTNSAGSGGAGGSGVCMSKQIPPPPADKGLGGDIEIIAVQKDVDLGDSQASTSDPSPVRYRTIGYDLDKICTSTTDPTRQTSCTLPAGSDGVPDGPQGQDNAMGQIIQLTRN